MLTTTEAFATVLHFAYVDSALFTFHAFALRCAGIHCGWYASSTTLLCQVRHWYGRCGAYTRTTALGGERARRGIQESVFSGGRRHAGNNWRDLHHWRLLWFVDDGHGGRRRQQRSQVRPRNLGRLIGGILFGLFVGLFIDRSCVNCSFKGCRTLVL